MIPSLAMGAERALATSPNRMAWAYIPNGAIMSHWTPTGAGQAFEFSRILKPFNAYRKDLMVISGLGHEKPGASPDGADAPPDPQQRDAQQQQDALHEAQHDAQHPEVPAGNARPGGAKPANLDGQPGGHAQGGSLYLTGVRPKKTIGMDVRSGTSVDQIIAAAVGSRTRLPSLELSCDDTRSVGNCDGGYSCVYNNTLCWRNPTMPLPPETNPRMVFERLFGTDDFGLDPKVRLRQAQYRKSILDSVGDRATDLAGTLGASDRRKVDEYLYGIREIEKRIQAMEQEQHPAEPGIDKPSGIPIHFAEHLKLMFDLQVLAWQSDLTRVMTMLIGREGSLRTYPEIGVPDSHHPLTHHRNNPVFIEKVAQINCYHAQLFTYFIDKLKSTPDGDGSLLDHSMVVYGSGISEGNTHSHTNLPTVIFGHGNGQLRTGQHVQYPEGTMMTRMFLTLMHCMGMNQDHFVNSTEMLSELVV